MIDKIDCLDVTLKWNDGNNDDVIYLSIIDDVFYYNDGTYKSNYKLSEIGLNFRMYKCSHLIQYLKLIGNEFEKEFLKSLKENLSYDRLDMIKMGFNSIVYELDVVNYRKRLSIVEYQV